MTLASDHAFWSYSKPQGTRTTSRCGSRRLGIVSTYPYRAHTAAEAVGDGPSVGPRCYGPVNPGSVEHYQGGKGVNGAQNQKLNKITFPQVEYLNSLVGLRAALPAIVRMRLHSASYIIELYESFCAPRVRGYLGPLVAGAMSSLSVDQGFEC